MWGDRALVKLISDYAFDTVLDVGCGRGSHAELFRAAGRSVTPIDVRATPAAELVGDYLDTPVDRHDCVWCCHVLEHQMNPTAFLAKARRDLHVGGVLAVTVPPYKSTIVSGHLTLWNAGLLLYHLVLAGFDCSDAAVKTYGYNVSVLVVRGEVTVEAQIESRLEQLADFFPVPVLPGGFDGDIGELNW